MRLRILCAAVCLASLFCLGGCLGRFASNQGRRQAARSSDHYIKKYGEPALEEYYGDDPETRQAVRQGRNDVADTVVRTGNPRQKTKVGVDDRGWLTNEQ